MEDTNADVALLTTLIGPLAQLAEEITNASASKCTSIKPTPATTTGSYSVTKIGMAVGEREVTETNANVEAAKYADAEVQRTQKK